MRLVGCPGAASPARFFLPRNRRVTANLAAAQRKILASETLRPLISNRFWRLEPAARFQEWSHIEKNQFDTRVENQAWTSTGRPLREGRTTPCAPSRLPYMVWLVGWLGGQPGGGGIIIGVGLHYLISPVCPTDDCNWISFESRPARRTPKIRAPRSPR